MRLEGKVALITGGTSGIGTATAVRFAREGAAVAITGRNVERGEQVVQDITADGGEAIFIHSDARLSADCRDAVEKTLARFGKIDVLFNNAGVFYPKTTVDLTEEEWDETIDSSLKGAFLMSKYALPSMIEDTNDCHPGQVAPESYSTPASWVSISPWSWGWRVPVSRFSVPFFRFRSIAR